jgi:hypothetical protein
MSIQRAERELADLRQEIPRLEAQLAGKRDRAQKLEHYVEVAREFSDGRIKEPDASHAGTNGAAQIHQEDTRANRAPRGGISGRAVQESIAIIRERNQGMQTKDLSALLESRGIRLGGKNPVGALSGYLSRTPEVVSDRIRGWILKECAEHSNENQQPTH